MIDRLWQIKHQLQDLMKEAKKIVQEQGIKAGTLHILKMPSAASGVDCVVELNAEKDTLTFYQNLESNHGPASFIVSISVKL